MEHPLVRAIRNQSHRMPHLDHLDPVPTHDGSLRNAMGNPIALTYESNYTPASYECYYMTPSLTQQEFYRNYVRVEDGIPKEHEAIKVWLQNSIDALHVHYNNENVNSTLTRAMYQHIMTLEAFNIWLTMSGRWYMYRAPVYETYKMSYPEYVFVIRKSDTESIRAKKRNEARSSKKQKKEEKEEDDEEEEAGEEEEQEEPPLSLAYVVHQVLSVTNNGNGVSEKEVTNILRDRMRDTLVRSRFSHLTLKDVPNDTVKYDIHGLPKTMRIINMLNAKDSCDAYWCHCLFKPREYIWKQGASKEYNLGVVACYAGFPLLVDLRRHCGSSSDDKKNKKKRTRTPTTTTTDIDGQRVREFFHNFRIIHPSKLRYTYYARNGMVYATRVVSVHNGYTLWDTFSLTSSYWNYIVDLLDNKQVSQSKWNAYYSDDENGELINGPNLVLGENTNNGQPIPGISNNQQVRYYVKNDKLDKYEEVYLLKFTLNKGKPTELQDRIDALFMICDTFTEVFVNLRLSMSGEGLSLKTVKESAFRVYKERMEAVENFAIGEQKKKQQKYKPLLSWLSSPNEHDLYLACKSFISKHHERTIQDCTSSSSSSVDEVIRDEVDSLCRTLGFNERLDQSNQIAVEFEVKSTNKLTRCESLVKYLSYCRIQLKNNILIPLARAWYLFNPVVELPDQDQQQNGDSTVAHLRQMVISEVCSPQFKLNLTRLVSSKRQLTTSDSDLLNCAYQVMKHELPETDPLLTMLNQVSKQQQKGEQKGDSFRERCKKRIECCMGQRGELDPAILLDICDKMAYKQGRVFGSIHEVKTMIEEIMLENEVNETMYRPLVRKFCRSAIHHKDSFINGLADSLKHV